MSRHYDASRKKQRGWPKTHRKVTWHQRRRARAMAGLFVEVLKEAYPQASIAALLREEQGGYWTQARPAWAKYARRHGWMTAAAYYATPTERTWVPPEPLRRRR